MRIYLLTTQKLDLRVMQNVQMKLSVERVNDTASKSLTVCDVQTQIEQNVRNP